MSNPDIPGPIPRPRKKKKARKRRIKTVSDTRKTEADKLWSALIKHREGFVCALCGKTEGLNSHHLLLKKNYRLRYSLLNGMVLCGGCHKFKAHSQDAIDRQRFYEFVICVKGKDIWDRLAVFRGGGSKTDLGMVIIYLKQELEKYDRN